MLRNAAQATLPSSVVEIPSFPSSPPRWPGPAAAAFPSHDPPPASAPNCAALSGCTAQAPPLSQTRHFPAPLVPSHIGHSSSPGRLSRGTPPSRPPPSPQAGAPLAALPYQLSPTCSGRPRPFSPFSIWRRWLSRSGTASRCGSWSSTAAVSAGLAETAAIAVCPPLAATAAGNRKGPSTATSGFWSRKRKQSPPYSQGTTAILKRDPRDGLVEGLGRHRRVGGDFRHQ